jgi:hypothetical protein
MMITRIFYRSFVKVANKKLRTILLTLIYTVIINQILSRVEYKRIGFA